MAAVTMATDATAAAPSRTASGARRSRRRSRAGVDPLTGVLFTVAAFLAVLALLAHQMTAATAHARPRQVIVQRRIYQTTVVETIPGTGGSSAGSVTQSVSASSSSGSASPAPATRASGA
jgi:hypothetical protein